MTGYLVNVAELLRRPGTRRDVAVDEVLTGLATSVCTAHRLTGTLVLESMNDSLSLEGTLTLAWSGECRRCLEMVEDTTELDVQEVFEREAVEGDTFPLDGDQVDLEPVLRELTLLALPLAPLCRADCRGPAPEAYPTGIEEDPPRDPRWAALDDLR